MKEAGVEPENSSKDIRQVINHIQSQALALHPLIQTEKIREREQGSFKVVWGWLGRHPRMIMLSSLATLVAMGLLASLIRPAWPNASDGSKAEQVSAAEYDNVSVETKLDEEPPGIEAVNSYSVSDEYPKYLNIPKLDDQTRRIVRLGIDNNSVMETPNNIWDAGWYDGSSLPGTINQSSLLVGHVSGPNSAGIFYNLYRLIEGDKIRLTMGSGKVHTYRVIAKKDVPDGNVDLKDYLKAPQDGKTGLTLMSADGEYNTASGQYDKRLAVFAIREN